MEITKLPLCGSTTAFKGWVTTGRPPCQDYSPLRQITKEEGLLRHYDKAIKRYINFGHAELVPSRLIAAPGRPTFYMPHGEVIRESSPSTKTRVVFYASSHAKGNNSLKECLETGKYLNIDLLNTLSQLRWLPITLTVHIDKTVL